MPRLVVDAQTPLLENDVAFGKYHRVFEHETSHAVGLDPHDEFNRSRATIVIAV
jgi:hypothetical protein